MTPGDGGKARGRAVSWHSRNSSSDTRTPRYVHIHRYTHSTLVTLHLSPSPEEGDPSHSPFPDFITLPQDVPLSLLNRSELCKPWGGGSKCSDRSTQCHQSRRGSEGKLAIPFHSRARRGLKESKASALLGKAARKAGTGLPGAIFRAVRASSRRWDRLRGQGVMGRHSSS